MGVLGRGIRLSFPGILDRDPYGVRNSLRLFISMAI